MRPTVTVVLACTAGALATSAVARAAAPPEPARPADEIDGLVHRAMREFGVPGIGIAVVKDGRVEVARGYGIRRVGAAGPVDSRTTFGVVSLTKAFTATGLALLVEEGKVEWDAPVTRYLPWFQLWDPWVTRELTVRDLLGHRAGFGFLAGDLLWFPGDTCDRAEVVRRLRFLPPGGAFRSGFTYSNSSYLVAGLILEAVSGRSWEAFVAERILAKAGMRDADPRLSSWGLGRNAAAPHARIEGGVRPIRSLGGDSGNPAIGISASPEDMASWMLVLLSGGKLKDGSSLYPEKAATELWSVVTPMRVGPRAEGPLGDVAPSMRGYSLAFVVQDYRSRRMIVHTGSGPGYSAILALLPDLGLGVTVLTNQESDEARRAVLYAVLDRHLGAPSVDWVDVLARKAARKAAREAAEAAEAERKRPSAPASGPSLPLSAYAGAFVDAWYGEVAIALEGKGLVLRFSGAPLLVGDLVHARQDTFVARWRERELRADAHVTFALGPSGAIERVKMEAVSPATDGSFDFHDLVLQPVRRPPAGKAP